MLWLSVEVPEAKVPVTVKLYVPAGVPGLPTVLVAPPPQDADSAMQSTIAHIRNNAGARMAPLALAFRSARSHGDIGLACILPIPLIGAAFRDTARVIANTTSPVHKPISQQFGGGRVGLPCGRNDAPVVVTCTMTVVAEPAFIVSEFGFTVQVACDGAPEQVKFTVPARAPSDATNSE